MVGILPQPADMPVAMPVPPVDVLPAAPVLLPPEVEPLAPPAPVAGLPALLVPAEAFDPAVPEPATLGVPAVPVVVLPPVVAEPDVPEPAWLALSLPPCPPEVAGTSVSEHPAKDAAAMMVQRPKQNAERTRVIGNFSRFASTVGDASEVERGSAHKNEEWQLAPRTVI